MEAVSLLDRQDTKFIFHYAQLNSILTELKKDYSILDVGNEFVSTYNNEYYDTKDFLFYNMHHRGELCRTKIRKRSYLESKLSFLELKVKTNRYRTIKKRIQINSTDDFNNNFLKHFIEDNSKFKIEDLTEQVYINFNRMTFIHKNLKDRCTIDFNLKASWGNKKKDFKELVVAELKQVKFDVNSSFNIILKKNKIYPQSFSKYGQSLSFLNENLKNNNFKLTQHNIKKILS